MYWTVRRRFRALVALVGAIRTAETILSRNGEWGSRLLESREENLRVTE